MQLILMLAAFFALLIAAYGGLYAGVLAFVIAACLMLAIVGIDALTNRDR